MSKLNEVPSLEDCKSFTSGCKNLKEFVLINGAVYHRDIGGVLALALSLIEEK